MKIKSITIMSHTALDFELNGAKPITIFRGKHSSLVLDLVREVIGDCNSTCDADSIDDGHFIIHADIDIDGKNYSACYIRGADFFGDNRIAVNFKPNSIEYSEDDTIEFLEKCKEINSDNRPVFIYPSALGEKNNVIAFIQALSGADRQVFLAVSEECSEIEHHNITNVFVN
jgi:hypothetical protein